MSSESMRLVLNLPLTVKKLLGDEDTAFQILFYFQKQLIDDLVGLEIALANYNYEEIESFVHSLRGSAGIAGAEEIWDNLNGFREVAKSRDMQKALLMYSDLKLKSSRFLETLNSIKKYTDIYGKKKNSNN